MDKESKNKLRFLFRNIVVVVSIFIGVSLCLGVSFLDIPFGWQIALIVLALVIIFAAATAAIVLERRACEYKCSYCGGRFTPSIGAYLMGVHTINRRLLKCPNCGVRNWCSLSLREE